MNNPVVARELAGVLRTRRAAAILVAVAVLFAAVVTLRWPTDAHVSVSGAEAQRIFRVFGYGLLAAVVLFVPVFPATSVVRERRSGTLALLLNSPMTPAAIYFGKLAGSLGVVLILLSPSLPAAAACSAAGGGITAGDVATLYGLLGLASLQFTTLALLVSTWARTADAALRITYGAVLGMTVVAPAPHLFLQGQEGYLAAGAEWLRAVSPVPPLMRLLRQHGIGSQGVITDSDVTATYAVLAAVCSGAFVVWAIARLNHRLFDDARPAGIVTEERGRGQRAARRAFFLVDPQRRKAGVRWFINPVMAKEFRCRRFGRMHWLLRLVAVCATASLGLTYLTTAGTIDWGAETIGGILVILQAALILFIAPSLAAVLISSELESGGWALLQTTPLSAAAILRGKLMSVVWTLALILFATLPGYLVMIVIEPAMRRQVELVVVSLILMALFTLAVSGAIGSIFRRTAASTVAAYGVLTAWCGTTLLVWLGRDAPFGHRTVEAALTVNPIATALSAIDAPGVGHYDLVPASWWFQAAASVLLFGLLAFRTWRLTRPR